jgi:hypothetical protein
MATYPYTFTGKFYRQIKGTTRRHRTTDWSHVDKARLHRQLEGTTGEKALADQRLWQINHKGRLTIQRSRMSSRRQWRSSTDEASAKEQQSRARKLINETTSPSGLWRYQSSDRRRCLKSTRQFETMTTEGLLTWWSGDHQCHRRLRRWAWLFSYESRAWTTVLVEIGPTAINRRVGALALNLTGKNI